MHRRGPPQLLRQLRDGLAHLQACLLEPAGNPQRPALVPKVPLQLTDDGRRGVRGELHLSRQVESIDRLDQRDHGHLFEVLLRLTSSREAAGQILGERTVKQNELVA
jgi:hypothetical protein